VIVRNLPPTISTSIDRIRSFRLSRTSYDAMTDTLTVEPEQARPTLDALLARIAAGVGPALGLNVKGPTTAGPAKARGGRQT
jgi:hypothetical protein